MCVSVTFFRHPSRRRCWYIVCRCPFPWTRAMLAMLAVQEIKMIYKITTAKMVVVRIWYVRRDNICGPYNRTYPFLAHRLVTRWRSLPELLSLLL